MYLRFITWLIAKLTSAEEDAAKLPKWKAWILQSALREASGYQYPSANNLKTLMTTGNWPVQLLTLNGVFSILSYVTRGRSEQKADVQVVKDLMEHSFKLGGDKALEALKIINSNKTVLDVSSNLKKLAKVAPEPALMEMIDCLFFVALSQGKPEESQIQLIKQAVDVFGFGPEVFNQIEERYNVLTQYSELQEKLESKDEDRSVVREIRAKRDPLIGAYSALGLDPNTAKDDVKKRYKKLVYEKHPDRLAAQAASQKEIDSARKEFEKMIAAYDFLKNHWQQKSAEQR